MEIRAYWQIIRRRWWIPLLLTLLVALLSAIQLRPWQTPPPTYSATLRLLVGVLPSADADLTMYDARFYAWQTSEYLVDDFTEVVSSSLFAGNVRQRLVDQGISIPPGAIRGSSATGRLHRVLTLTIHWPSEQELTAIAAAVVDELTTNSAFYFAQLGTENTEITILDQPTISVIQPSLRFRIEWPLRTLLALIVGLGIVFLLDYLDTSVRSSQDLEAIGVPVLGMIPKQ
jgi:capsular polysaccharide biosynthesis protein